MQMPFDNAQSTLGKCLCSLTLNFQTSFDSSFIRHANTEAILERPIYRVIRAALY